MSLKIKCPGRPTTHVGPSMKDLSPGNTVFNTASGERISSNAGSNISTSFVGTDVCAPTVPSVSKGNARNSNEAVSIFIRTLLVARVTFAVGHAGHRQYYNLQLRL